ncbi:hypothetical protein [Pseudogemmobacter faecipullorum]|uniref:Uncharacterized protein n=1 Tax=Pseudogemmobacter faecipullorum TaxID=2755041 RepID=A0ABS8CM76_9RHOB|nr:hypothetical protein [Pseudogemmobacter faecipullorum]MCB5410481.1 hypothetical protein [Pseudogemmobacter faecipullorum]
MKRFSDCIIGAFFLALAWMQVDTWRQARETNEFMRRVQEAIAEPATQAEEG